MPAKRPPATPRRPCKGAVGKKRVCWARDGSDWCSNHDPAEEERRRAAGRVRHPRFAKAKLVGGHVFDASKAPSIPHLIDRAMGIADSVEAGRLDAGQGQAAVAALRLAWQALEKERERSDKLKFAWEREQEARASQETARESTSDAGDGSSPEEAPTPVVPPWMRSKPAN